MATTLGTVFEELGHFGSPGPVYLDSFQSMMRRDEFNRINKTQIVTSNIEPQPTNGSHKAITSPNLLFDDIGVYSDQFQVTPGSDLNNNGFTKTYNFPTYGDSTPVFNTAYMPIPIVSLWLQTRLNECLIIVRDININNFLYNVRNYSTVDMKSTDKFTINVTILGVVNHQDV